MKKRTNFFVVIVMLIFQGEIFGQTRNTLFNNDNHSIVTSFLQTSSKYKPVFARLQVPEQVGVGNFSRFSFLYVISQSNYSKDLGFFCKKELQLDKFTPIPFRFRLGSMEYVNYLEQKPNAIKPR